MRGDIHGPCNPVSKWFQFNKANEETGTGRSTYLIGINSDSFFCTSEHREEDNAVLYWAYQF